MNSRGSRFDPACGDDAAVANSHSLGAAVRTIAPAGRIDPSTSRPRSVRPCPQGYSGGQSPRRVALSRVEIVCSKPAIGIVISVTDSKWESVTFVTAILPLAPFEQAIW